MTRVQRILRKSMKHRLGRKTNASSSVLRNLRIWTVRMSHTLSCSINEKAIPLGTIHTVHDYFMGVEGNSLLPFDRMDSEWKQNHRLNQGKQRSALLSCPSAFHRLTCTAWEEEGMITVPSGTPRHGGYHLKLPIQKLTHKPSSFVPWTWWMRLGMQ